MSATTLQYTNGKFNYQAVLCERIEKLALAQKDVASVMRREFPKGTKVVFKWGKGKSSGTVTSHYMNSAGVGINVLRSTGNQHHVNVKNVLEIE